MPITLLQANDSLQPLLEALEGCDRIAVDTEADSLHNYHEKVCLIQVTADGQNFLVDPLTHQDISPFINALKDKELVFHGADYDLRMLRLSFDFSPARPIFDTMLAAQLLGHEQLGLAALVERYYETTLPKEGQKSDWSKRPLPQKLIEYAANDTRYLIGCAEKLERELDEKGRRDWHAEACERAVETSRSDTPRDMERAWRVKGAHQLDRRGLALLRALWHWREEEASRLDRPTFKLLTNSKLLEIVQKALDKPQQPAENLVNLPRNFRGQRLRNFENALREGLQVPEHQWPSLKPPRKDGQQPALPREDEALTRRLIAARDKIAKPLELPGHMLAPRNAMVRISRSRPDSPEALREAGGLMDWQADLLAPALLDALNPRKS